MLYIYNTYNLTNIVCREKIQKAEKNALSVVKALCERELFSFESRTTLTKRYCNIKSKIPIYINKELLLMPTHSPKRHDTIWINYFMVFSFQKFFGKTLVLFRNLEELELDITYSNFSLMMNKASKITEYMNKRLLIPLI